MGAMCCAGRQAPATPYPGSFSLLACATDSICGHVPGHLAMWHAAALRSPGSHQQHMRSGAAAGTRLAADSQAAHVSHQHRPSPAPRLASCPALPDASAQQHHCSAALSSEPAACAQESFLGGPQSMDFPFDGDLSPSGLPASNSGFRDAIQGMTSLPQKISDPDKANRPRPAALHQRPSAAPAEPRGKGAGPGPSCQLGALGTRLSEASARVVGNQVMPCHVCSLMPCMLPGMASGYTQHLLLMQELAHQGVGCARACRCGQGCSAAPANAPGSSVSLLHCCEGHLLVAQVPPSMLS